MTKIYYARGVNLQLGEIWDRGEGSKPFRVDDLLYEGVEYLENYKITYIESGSKGSIDSRELHSRFRKLADSLEEYQNQTKEEETMTERNALYEITTDTKTVFGKYLTENSEGLWVMEVTPSNEVLVVRKEDCKKVMPYTVGIQFFNKSTVYHYKADKGQFEVGDLLVDVSSGSFARVKAINTESDKATKRFKGIKIQGEKVE